MKLITTYYPSLTAIEQAAQTISNVVTETPLQHNINASNTYNSKV